MKHALLLLALIATQAHAQIIYTDVDPDATYTGSNDTCSLDLDNDGNIDFLIVQHSWDAPCPGGGQPACAATNTAVQNWVKITPMGTNAVARTGSYASQLPQWDAIDPALAWSNSSGRILVGRAAPMCAFMNPGGFYICYPGLLYGIWWDNDSYSYPYFLGLRFDSGGSTFYGWARLSVASGESFTLRSYAYNSVPGEAIVAGDDGTLNTGITSTALRGMQLSPNPFTSVLSITLPTGTTGAVNYRVLSLLGQAVITRTVAATSGPSAITLDLASLAPGSYLLEIETDGERMVRKVVKE